MNNLGTFLNALNVEIGDEIMEQENGVIFCHNNMIKRGKVPLEAIEDALNNVDYYHEDDTFTTADNAYTDEDILALARVIDAYGADLDLNEVRDKQIWFERADMI